MHIVKIQYVFFHAVGMLLRMYSNRIGSFVRKTLNEAEEYLGKADLPLFSRKAGL